MGLREVWKALRLRDEQVSVGSETTAQEDPDHSPVMPARLRQEAHHKNPDDQIGHPGFCIGWEGEKRGEVMKLAFLKA